MSGKKIQEIINQLKQQRDELALQIHLGANEVQEEFEQSKEKLDKMLQEYEPVKDAVDESAEKIFASLKTVSDEIVDSFHRIRKSL